MTERTHMKKSWKTTAGGIIAAIGVGISQSMGDVAWLRTVGEFLQMLGALVIGFSARDNKVTSEQAGLK